MKAAAALMIVLFASAALAQQTGSALVPNLITHATITLDQSGEVRAYGGRMVDLQLNVSVPANAGNQNTTILNTGTKGRYSLAQSEEGNQYMSIIAQKPAGTIFPYEISSRVETGAISVSSLPSSFVVPQSVKKYLESDQKVQSDNPRIKELAAGITQNSSGAFEKAAKIAEWVNDYVEYDETYVGQELNSLEVLGQGRGVCVEYSTLFVALARASGIPARYVGGYVYSDRLKQWAGHLWAEVYLGKWVQVDPTWLQAGAIDALHVPTFRSSRILGGVSADATVYPQETSIDVMSNDQSGAIVTGAHLQSVQSREPMLDYGFYAAHAQLGENDRTVIVLGINSSEYFIMPVQASICTGQNVLSLQDAKQTVVVQPGENYVQWEVQTFGIEPNVIYTCPISISSPYLGEKSIDIKASSGWKKNAQLGVKLFSDKITLGQQQTIYVQADRASAGTVRMVTQEGEVEVPVSAGYAVFTYEPLVLGQNKIYAYTKSGFGFASFDVAQGEEEISIEAKYPGEIYQLNETKVLIMINTSSKNPAQAQIFARLGSFGANASALILGNQTISLFVTPQEAGSVPLEISVEAGGKIQSRSYLLSIIRTVQEENKSSQQLGQNSSTQANKSEEVQGGAGWEAAPTKEQPKCATALISIMLLACAFAFYGRNGQ